MSISNEVNIDVLNEIYTLSAFHGLRAAHPDDEWNDQMTEETQGHLPNSEVFRHADGEAHDETSTSVHMKSNPALAAMQQAVNAASGKGGSIDLPRQSSIETAALPSSDKNSKPSKLHDGQLDHNSLTASDYLTTPTNRSTEDVTTLQE